MSPRGAAVALTLALASACGGGPSRPDPIAGPADPVTRWHSDAVVDVDANELSTELCVERGHVRALRFEHGTGAIARALRVDAAGSTPLRVDGGGETVSVSLAPSECVRYVVRLDRLRDEHARRHGRSLLLHTDAWLAEPAPRGDDPVATLEMRVEGEGTVVTPFPPSRDQAARLDETALGFPSVTMVRPARVVSARIAGTPTTIAVATDALGDLPLAAWLSAHGQAVASLFGSLPVPRLTVFVVPARERSDEPVAFARTLRGGGAMLVAHVSTDASREALLTRDWVATHELTHLALPYVNEDDAWLSEGITTYYQEILRARAGLQTEERAWARLVDGFRRGREQYAGRTLREASAALSETRDYARLYWGGAALMLELDVALREAHGWGLDRVARAWSECCAWPARIWSADELISRASGELDSEVVRRVVERGLDAEEPLAVGDTLRRLGVEVGEDGDVRLLDDAPAASVRRAIMGEDGQG